VLQRFTGPGLQVPPMYSALKYAGRPLYALAREGVEIDRTARPVQIHALALRSLGDGAFEFEVRCSKGTYVRTLGEDLARALGTCGHLTALRRTSFGAFAGLPLHGFDELEGLDVEALDARLLPADAALATWSPVRLDAEGVDHVRHGRAVSCEPTPPGPARIQGPDGALVGLGVVDGSGRRLAPTRLLSNAS